MRIISSGWAVHTFEVFSNILINIFLGVAPAHWFVWQNYSLEPISKRPILANLSVGLKF